ncbi:MAG: acyltransferase [Bacteroidota bacterium]|nr:acyltransferase [Bacteroidota bacterium]
MKVLTARIASWLFRKMQGAELYLVLRTLRERGQHIAASATFGPRVQLRIHADATVDIGDRVEVLQDSWLIAHPGDTLLLGERVFISQHCTVSGSVRIGSDTLIGGYVTIIDGNHVIGDTARPIAAQGGVQKPIEIGNDVWIGSNAVILQGVRIGDHAVVAANATVTRDVPAWSVVGGTPARVLRDRREP